MKKILIILLVALTSNLYAEPIFQPLNQADLPTKASKISYDDSGKIIELVTSHWEDRIKTKEGLEYYSYEQGYNYHKKQGFLKIYTKDGTLVEEKWNTSIDGGVAAEEVLNAFEIIKNNDVIKGHFATTDEAIMLYGGFNFKDDKECVLGRRCVHVFSSTLNRTVLSHSIVRLTDSKVVYPIFDKKKHQERISKIENKNQTKRKL